MYDPNVGRWLEEDPIGFDAGDTNLYRYVGNNPTNATDLSGLEEKVRYISDNGGKDASSGLMGLDKNHEMPFGNGKLKITVQTDVKIKFEYKSIDGELTQRDSGEDYIKIVVSSTATDKQLKDVHFVQLVKRKVTPADGKTIDLYSTSEFDSNPLYNNREGKEVHLDARYKAADGMQWTTGVVRAKDGKSMFLEDTPSIFEEIPGKKDEVFSAWTYIVYENQVLYVVEWKRVGRYVNGKWQVTYEDVKGNTTKPLPDALAGASFRIGYKKVDKNGKLSEPYEINNWLKK